MLRKDNTSSRHHAEAFAAARWWGDIIREYATLLSMGRLLTEESIVIFEKSLAATIDAQLRCSSFCIISQRILYEVDNLLLPHLQAADIPTDIPFFNPSMQTVIRSGEVWAYGGYNSYQRLEKRRLTLLSE